MNRDPSFILDRHGLLRAIELLDVYPANDGPATNLPLALPDHGIGEMAALEGLAPEVLGRAAYLDASKAFAHMDPPTPWITWALALWNARLNQNLLHPGTAPFARDAEHRVIDWIAPLFGMDGGHFVPGSSLANLTALWVARDLAGVKRVVASSACHISVKKAAKILGLAFVDVAIDQSQRLDPTTLPSDLSDCCLVLTAGTTIAGAIDPLDLCGTAAWTHVDAAWAGPLRFSARHSAMLAGIERADSVAVSAHKWLFQPKESACILFRGSEAAHTAISFDGAYLAAPNIGVQGSRGAAAIMLLATLLAWGRSGVAARIEHCLSLADALADFIATSENFELFPARGPGVTLFRPRLLGSAELQKSLPAGIASIAEIDGDIWLRCVAANPNAAIGGIIAVLEQRWNFNS